MSWEQIHQSWASWVAPEQVLPPGQPVGENTSHSREVGECGIPSSKRVSYTWPLHSKFPQITILLSSHLPCSWGKGSGIKAVHKINQQELALKQLRSLNIAHTQATLTYSASCSRNSSGRQRHFMHVRDLVFCWCGLTLFKESVSVVTFYNIPTPATILFLFPQFQNLFKVDYQAHLI